jgi:outer membrane lipoprotein carrier protein
MKNYYSFTSLSLFICLNAFSQNDQEAISILDRFSARALGAPSVSIEFNLLTVNQVEGTNSSVNGSLILCGEKYRLNLKDNIIWFNGETSWNYLPDEKEVTITSPDKNDDSFLNSPSILFSWYKKGYKTRLLEEKAGVFLVDLYPEDINSDHIRIRLNLSNPALDLKSLEYKYKNGITVTVNVISYDLKQKPDGAAFVFSPDKYKGVEIIDMR